ncbi:MAG: hypothetical protein HMLKMBBP_02185 [Planctomycetes bacterium]|nr:hypothetical protein [Planctomycetota bacterium]
MTGGRRTRGGANVTGSGDVFEFSRAVPIGTVYRVHDKEKRQLCWAHLLRNFLGLEELGGTAKSLGVGGQRIVKAVFRD